MNVNTSLNYALLPLQVAQLLIDMNADLSLRCKWTQMTALHYAAYFDVAPVLKALLMKSKVRPLSRFATYTDFSPPVCLRAMIDAGGTLEN